MCYEGYNCHTHTHPGYCMPNFTEVCQPACVYLFILFTFIRPLVSVTTQLLFNLKLRYLLHTFLATSFVVLKAPVLYSICTNMHWFLAEKELEHRDSRIFSGKDNVKSC